ncbi:unnamed protein product, partial [Leptidea sinapis]
MRSFTIVLFILQLNLFCCKERYNPLSDFILHEAGIPNTSFNKDKNGQPTNPTISSTSTPPSNKRDYVASQFPTLKPITRTSSSIVTPTSTEKVVTPSRRDYVAPQYPTKSPTPSTMSPPVQSPTQKSTNITPIPKRDYVSPNFPTLKPIQQNKDTPGKVKDLVNFYDSKTNQGNSFPSKGPSYSSIAQGSVNPRPMTNTKPGSYSAIVSGTPQVTTSGPHLKPSTTGKKPDARPVSPTTKPTSKLPSSIVVGSNNKNQGQATASDEELQLLSEQLLKKDTNNAAKYIKINYQEKTTSQSKDDKAPLPLLNISPEAWNIPTIQKFVPLLDNYERDTLLNEYVTAQERNEENAFLDVVMTTPVFRHLMGFLKDKGYVTPDPRQQREFIKQIWFGLYSRGKGKISLHNWVYFSKEEAANRANYLGYLKYSEFGDVSMTHD